MKTAKWDSDMATLLLLIHLLPPQPGGKTAAKISAVDAASRLVVYHKSPATTLMNTFGKERVDSHTCLL
ncbi:hypothetical protein MATL_G00176030 [Megalops atlanticus]|uniref:Secreted protein n=1 Tax=Megalops atlanticus TaxID=7932 RepID=A0A9D3PLD0_MEGAT|nr:hypothetical protein MATL_G00176030 [Megalops atlanticus]